MSTAQCDEVQLTNLTQIHAIDDGRTIKVHDSLKLDVVVLISKGVKHRW